MQSYKKQQRILAGQSVQNLTNQTVKLARASFSSIKLNLPEGDTL